MDSTTSPNHRHGSLPKLSTSKELSRRDSLSSSRTRDSGYNSDLDLSCSPLDYVDLDQHILIAPPPSFPCTFISNNKALAKTLQGFQDVSALPRSQITSSPTTVSQTTKKLKQNQDCELHVAPTFAVQDVEQSPSEQDNDVEKWIKHNLPQRPDKRVTSITSLSSASSCEIYTDSDMSDEQDEIDVDTSRSGLPKPTNKIIDIIMRKIEVNLRLAAFRQCTGGTASSASSSHGSKSQQRSRKASQHTGKRKLGSDDSLHPNNEEDDDPNKRRRGSLATISSSDTGIRFACPFYKHEPHRFRNRRTCPGPGWPTVHRMKEHLYRAHAQSIYCARCYAMFDTDTDLSHHLRSAHCNVSDPQPVEGIDRETVKALHKRSPQFRLEEDRWRDVYRLLFPDVEVEDIPSPFYTSHSPSPSDSSRAFRRTLLQRIQHELVATATHIPGPVEQRLLQQVASIIRRCENELLSNFETESVMPEFIERRPSDTSTLSAESTQGNTTPMPAHTGTAAQLVSPRHNSMNASGFSAWGNHVGRTLSPAVVWDQQQHPLMQDSIAWWIDLDAGIPPPEDACTEPFVEWTMPTWTG